MALKRCFEVAVRGGFDEFWEGLDDAILRVVDVLKFVEEKVF
jgi:hypothetical protein